MYCLPAKFGGDKSSVFVLTYTHLHTEWINTILMQVTMLA